MQTIITKFLPPTNTRGARIKAKCWLTDITIAYPVAEVNEAHKLAAEVLITKLKMTTDIDWKIVASGETPDGSGYAFIIK